MLLERYCSFAVFLYIETSFVLKYILVKRPSIIYASKNESPFLADAQIQSVLFFQALSHTPVLTVPDISVILPIWPSTKNLTKKKENSSSSHSPSKRRPTSRSMRRTPFSTSSRVSICRKAGHGSLAALTETWPLPTEMWIRLSTSHTGKKASQSWRRKARPIRSGFWKAKTW